MSLPQKSLETPKFPEGRQIIKIVTNSKKTHFSNKDFPDFARQMSQKEFGKEWQMDIFEEKKLTLTFPVPIPDEEIN